MKEVLIILIILILILSSAIFVMKYLNNTSESLIGKLEEEKNKIESFDNSEEEKKEIQDLNNDIYKEWEEINEKWSIIVLHNELDLIETSLIAMRTKIEIGNFNESLKEIETAIFLLNHIKENERINLKNIF